MEHLNESNLFTFCLQALLLISYIPVSYFGYRWVRAPLKYHQNKLSLSQLGLTQSEYADQMTTDEYQPEHYFWPVTGACMAILATYTMTHPYPVGQGLWAGFLEEVINVFGQDDSVPRDILSARYLYWGFLGAWIYSFHLTFRRFLAYDLTPSVYVFTSNRFILAFTVGSIVGVGLGTFSSHAGVPFDINLVTVSMVVFFIGFFPDQGVTWLAEVAKRALRIQGNISRETRLSEVEGLSIWHQGRLHQEGLENVQNLATANLPSLVVSTPFTVSQIIDWVDQAILIIYASPRQLEILENVGLRCASDLVVAAGDEQRLEQLVAATGLDKNGLTVLNLAIQSAPNIKLVSRFRWQASLDDQRVIQANQLVPLQPQPVVTDQLFS